MIEIKTTVYVKECRRHYEHQVRSESVAKEDIIFCDR